MANAKATWLSKEAKKAKVLANQIKRFSRRKAIHDFRVCIKKIRAIVSIADQANDFKQHYPTLTKIFKKTGRLRDLQIIHSRMSTLPAWIHSPAANQLIRAQQKDRRNAVLEWLQHADKIEKVMNELQAIIDHKNLGKQAFRKHATLTQNESEWHEVRKQIKTEMYQQDASANPLAAETKIHKQLDEMQKALGNWHDWQITRKWVEKQKPLLPSGEFWLLYQQSTTALQKAADLCRKD